MSDGLHKFLYKPKTVPSIFMIMTKSSGFIKNYMTSLLLALIVAGTLLSCGIGVRTRAILGGKIHITVNVTEKANQNNPVAMDFLLVYDKNLLGELLKMSSKDWFEKREQIKLDYLEGEGVECWSWEWVPGQKIPIQVLPLKANAEGALIFAEYLCPGAHRIRVQPFDDIVIHLLEKDFLVEIGKIN
ncbi:MAG: hypothetical protein B6245_14030 [Desulfobacteraceae bacterium 4572_88]|nr:MAG: hypothetical protein B6245_14030 [Desulfobacteraceae bacterium 4572_88]